MEQLYHLLFIVVKNQVDLGEVKSNIQQELTEHDSSTGRGKINWHKLKTNYSDLQEIHSQIGES